MQLSSKHYLETAMILLKFLEKTSVYVVVIQLLKTSTAKCLWLLLQACVFEDTAHATFDCVFLWVIFTGEKENSEFRPYIHHLMLPTALFGLSCINSQLSSMWQHIKQTACKFTALPPNDLYLPSPELYCPQVPFSEPVCNVSAAQKAFEPAQRYDFLMQVSALIWMT